jgi:multidrug efflux pump subunit AcrA (membrane-fusion protein)
MKKKIQTVHATATHTTHRVYKRITATIIKYPERSFFSVLGALFLMIIIGNIISRPAGKPASAPVTPKPVAIYGIGQAPRIQITARVETTGVVKIIAQTGGIVQAIYKKTGEQARRGDWLFWISTNYQGGTLPTVTRQMAQKNYDFAKDNYDAQKDIIGRQRSLADSGQSQFTDMRDITNNSISSTQSLIDQDQDLVNSLNDYLTYLESTNTDGAKDPLIIQAKQGKTGAQAGINSLKVALANAQYQANSDKAPTRIANTQHDLTIAQLDLQQKSLDLNRELAKLNLQVAQISEALMYPASPVTGVVERVYVTPGQNITSGTLLASITGDSVKSTVVALVTAETAKNISRIEKSKLTLGNKTVEMYPMYISTQPTDGGLHSVLFSIPPEDESLVTNGSSLLVELPIGSAQSTNAVPYVPLDAIYQTQDASYLYVAVPAGNSRFTVKSEKVTLGSVYGQYVEVVKGLSPNDQVITTRSVLDGDIVTVQ